VSGFMAESRRSPRFPTTHWSQVIAAGDRATPEARAALAEQYEAYWYPRLRPDPTSWTSPR